MPEYTPPKLTKLTPLEALQHEVAQLRLQQAADRQRIERDERMILAMYERLESPLPISFDREERDQLRDWIREVRAGLERPVSDGRDRGECER